MRRAVRGIGISTIVAIFLLAAGCAANGNFIYKPNPPAAGQQKVPVGVAVLPFADGTEDFTKRGSALGALQFNLVKAGIGGTISALPPEFWGKSFADDLAASGSFRSARFIYSPSEVRDEAFLVDGTVKKAAFAATLQAENDFLVSFKATRMSDKKVLWEKEVGKKWKTPQSLHAACWTGSCVKENNRADLNRTLAALFAEARADLVATLGSPDGGAGGGAGASPEGKPPGGSVEQTIDKILKGK